MHRENTAFAYSLTDARLSDQIIILRGKRDTLRTQIELFPFGSLEQIETRREFNAVVREIEGLTRILNEKRNRNLPVLQAERVQRTRKDVQTLENLGEKAEGNQCEPAQSTVGRQIEFRDAYAQTLIGNPDFAVSRKGFFGRVWARLIEPKKVITGDYLQRRKCLRGLV